MGKITVVADHKHPFLRRLLGIGLLVGATYTMSHAIDANRHDDDEGWEPQPFPFPPQPRAASEAAWVDAVDDTCPATHPVKAKLSSGIYHVPGGASYERTKPDRCYLDATAAEADGLHAWAKGLTPDHQHGIISTRIVSRRRRRNSLPSRVGERDPVVAVLVERLVARVRSAPSPTRRSASASRSSVSRSKCTRFLPGFRLGNLLEQQLRAVPAVGRHQRDRYWSAAPSSS